MYGNDNLGIYNHLQFNFQTNHFFILLIYARASRRKGRQWLALFNVNVSIAVGENGRRAMWHTIVQIVNVSVSNFYSLFYILYNTKYEVRPYIEVVVHLKRWQKILTSLLVQDDQRRHEKPHTDSLIAVIVVAVFFSQMKCVCVRIERNQSTPYQSS